jgi:hypothetical protein
MSLFRASDPAADADWSVPTPRGPYPVNPAYPDPDGPTQRLYRPVDEPEPLSEPDESAPYEPSEHRPRHNRGVLVAVIIAVLALLASGAASYVAWSAKGRADKPGTITHPPAALPVTPPVSVPSAMPTSAAPTETDGATPGYTLRYAQEPLQIRTACGDAALIDLDVPAVDAPEQDSDVRYDNKCGADGPLLSVGPGGKAGSHVTDPDLDAPGCADAVDTEPLDPGETVPVQKGTVLCVRTGGGAGGHSMLALVEVTGLGEDGAASLRATGWTATATPSGGGSAADSAPPSEPDVPSEGATPGD